MNQHYEYTGQVIEVKEREDFSSFSKRTVVVSDQEEKYPQKVPFIFSGKYVDMPDEKEILRGQKVKVRFSLRGREWQGKHYAENFAFAISKLEEAPAPPPQQDTFAGVDDDNDDEEDVPF
ncbi:DUF3127 domain-containing protein [Cerasicoccus frondis]|uniref:DUF3127 domain-containing protein n=1 Tax=Cerasicoccus frondis TaxID=490090 RepID=UPI002852D9D8|nr:DUF3127 domain-containing protein [Cerasicoccus frondis]